MIIIKDVPGMSDREVYEELTAISPGQGIRTGHGGFAVDEDTAERFLLAYLIASGRRAAPVVPEEKPRKQTTRSSTRTRGRRSQTRKET